MNGKMSGFVEKFDTLLSDYRRQGGQVSDEEEVEWFKATLPFFFASVKDWFDGLLAEIQNPLVIKAKCKDRHDEYRRESAEKKTIILVIIIRTLVNPARYPTILSIMVVEIVVIIIIIIISLVVVTAGEILRPITVLDSNAKIVVALGTSLLHAHRETLIVIRIRDLIIIISLIVITAVKVALFPTLGVITIIVMVIIEVEPVTLIRVARIRTQIRIIIIIIIIIKVIRVAIVRMAKVFRKK